MDVRGLVKLASGTEKGEEKRGESVTNKHRSEILRQKHEDSTFVSCDSDKTDARNEI